MQLKGTIVPKEKLKEMGMNFDVYESKGVVKFKNGMVMENIVKVGDFGYQLSKDDKYAFVLMMKNNDEIESYSELETSILHDMNKDIEELKNLRKNRFKNEKSK
jgi:hypothetical protein